MHIAFRTSLLLLALGCSIPGAVAAPPAFTGPAIAGQLEAPPRKEASGLAFSRRSPGLLWTHDDSGGQPALYALTPGGKLVGSVRLGGLRNEDWEDLAAFELDGKAWLLIADTGDNNARRPVVALHLIEEPARERLSVDQPVTLAPAWTLRLRYDDGPRDCESVAVDIAERAIYLLSKRDDTPRLYRVDLPAGRAPGAVVVARRVGLVPHIPEPSAAEMLLKRGHLGRRRSEVTSMDFSGDGTLAAVLAYGGGMVFERKTGESWADALAREPAPLTLSGLLQGEAICFTPDAKSLYIASEGPQPLLRYDRQ